MRPSIVLTILLLSTLLLPGCAPWQTVSGRYTGDQYFEVELPDGWWKYNHASESLLITRDGMSLQKISINRKEIDKELSFTKKKLAKGMLPQEIAQVIMDDIRSNPKIRNQEIVENVPTKIDGNPGFKLAYAYLTDQGLQKRGLCYGFLSGDSYYLLLYEAPKRYYFPRDLPAFEKMTQSFRLSKKAGA